MRVRQWDGGRSLFRTAAMALVVAVVVIQGTAIWSEVAAQGSGPVVSAKCGEQLGSEAASPSPAQPVALSPEALGATIFTIEFGRSRQERTSEDIQFVFNDTVNPIDDEVFPVGTPVKLDVGILKRTSDGHEVDPSAIRYSAIVNRRGISVRVCVQPDGIDPGIYNTNVVLASANLQDSPTELRISLSEHRFWLPGAVLALAWVVGAFILFAQAQSKRGATLFSKGMPRQVLHWANHNYVAIGLGAVAAWGAWQADYWDSGSWGSDGMQYFELLVASTTAFLGAAVVGGFVDGKLGAESKQSSDASGAGGTS